MTAEDAFADFFEDLRRVNVETRHVESGAWQVARGGEWLPGYYADEDTALRMPHQSQAVVDALAPLIVASTPGRPVSRADLEQVTREAL